MGVLGILRIAGIAAFFATFRAADGWEFGAEAGNLESIPKPVRTLTRRDAGAHEQP